MAENPDDKELLQVLNEFQVDCLIVRGFAVMKYGEPRYTKDLDVWVNNSALNSFRLVEALKKFGAPLEHDGITAGTLTQKQVVYQIGIAPVRMTHGPWSTARSKSQKKCAALRLTSR